MVIRDDATNSPHFATKSSVKEHQSINWNDPNFGLDEITILHDEDGDDESKLLLPELNLHHYMAAGEWEELLQFLYRLQDRDTGNDAADDASEDSQSVYTSCSSETPDHQDRLLNAFCVRDDGDHLGALPVHTLAWKAPPLLAAYMLSLIPRSISRELLLAVDDFGNTPLHLACANLDEELEFGVIRDLLEVVPEALEVQNNGGDSPLHLLVTSPAFRRGGDFHVEAACEEALTALLNGSKYLALAQNHAGLTLLHAALAHGAHERILDRLLQIAPEAAKIATHTEGMLPIHYVAVFGSSNRTPWTIAQRLLWQYPSGLTARTTNGDSPLHLLMSNASKYLNEQKLLDRNTTKLAELLVGNVLEVPVEDDNNSASSQDTGNDGNSNSSSSGASNKDSKNEKEEHCPLFLANNEQMYPLHCCAAFETPAQLTRLMMSSPRSAEASALTTRFGSTALHLLCASSLNSQNSIENLEALATPQACLVRDDNQRTPLVVAVQNTEASAAVIKCLCQSNQDAALLPTVKNYYPLHLAVQSSNARESKVKVLVRATVRANGGGSKNNKASLSRVTNASGNTPLHEACRYGAPAGIIYLLVEHYPAAIFARNEQGQKPINLAKAHGSSYPPDVYNVLVGTNRLEQSQRQSLLNDVNRVFSSSSSSLEGSGHPQPSRLSSV